MRTVTLRYGKICQRFRIPTGDDWDELAEYVAVRLKPGDIIALSGPLGAGKTTFVQALAKTLGVKRRPLSPTFALLCSYKIPQHKKLRRLLHLDAYRLDDERDLRPLDLETELADGETVLVIEWAEKIKNWLKLRERLRSRPGFPRLSKPRQRT